MTDGQNFFVLICLIYAVECVYWVHKTAFIFRGIFIKKIDHVPSEDFLGNERGGFVWSWPLPSLGYFFKISQESSENSVQSGSWDLKEAKERHDLWKSEIRLLQCTAHILFFYLFIFAPFVVYTKGLMTFWWRLFISVELLSLLNGIVFFFKHRALYPEQKLIRFQKLFISIIYPIASIRTPDTLSYPLFEKFHPLVAASIICSPEVFQNFASRYYRDNLYPLSGEKPKMEQIQLIEKFLKKKKIDLQSLLKPLEKTDPQSISYCPRCLTEYRTATEFCSDCTKITTRRYE